MNSLVTRKIGVDMTEKEVRELYIQALLDTVGSLPYDVFERPLSPLLCRFAQLVALEVRAMDRKKLVDA